MNKRKTISWLYGELPKLEQAGILSPGISVRIRDFYGPAEPENRRSLMFLLLAILGATLIGLGILLLLAHNWDELSRPMRVLLSFLPMLAGQLLVGWTLLKNSSSQAWREGSGLFLTLAIGACISLISQTYHIMGSMSEFLLTWILLGALLIYLLNALSVALLYLAAILCWAGVQYFESRDALFYWPMLLFVLPHFYHSFKAKPNGPRTHLLTWGLCLSLVIAPSLVFSRTTPGIVDIIYGNLLALMLFAGIRIRKVSRFNAFLLTGLSGIVLRGLTMTYNLHWQRLDTFKEFIFDLNKDGLEHVAAFSLLVLSLLVMLSALQRRNWLAVLGGAFPILVAFGVLTHAAGISAEVFMVSFNAYLIILGGLLIFHGLTRDQLLTVNAGMIILCMLIVARFFDTHFSFTVRGVLFILLGCAVLTANLLLARRASHGKEAL